ncbi:MAG: DNA polymerase III subunit delta [bacterium]|nr:DNA polymerase III subunit delta [bacterium]
MLIFLYGQDNFRSRLKLNELKDKYLREVDKLGSGLKTVDGAKAALAEIAAAAGPSSLLSKKRLIIIEDIFLNKDQAIFDKLIEYFKSHEKNDNIIIFWDSGLKTKKVKNALLPMLAGAGGQDKPLNKKQSAWFKFLSAQKYAYSFNLFSHSEAANWVKKQAAAAGGRISAKAAETLVSLAGNDGWRLKNELDKLLNFKAAGQLTAARAEIEIEDIKSLVQGNFNENIFALTDALSSKNKTLAVKLLDEQVEAGLNDSYLLNMFIRQFKILLQIRQALDQGLSQRQIAGQLKLHPFVLQKGLAQARNFALSALKNILSQLVRIDYEVKSGQADYLTGLNLLIAKI